MEQWYLSQRHALEEDLLTIYNNCMKIKNPQQSKILTIKTILKNIFFRLNVCNLQILHTEGEKVTKQFFDVYRNRNKQ